MDLSQNGVELDRISRAIWYTYIVVGCVAFVINALCSVSTFGWILGWYLLIGHIVMAWLALQCNSFVICGGMFFSLILQVIDLARHDSYIALFLRCLSMAEGYEIARFAVIVLLNACIILTTIACSRRASFKAIATPYLIESILVIMFINVFLYRNALIANVLGVFMTSCIFAKSSLRCAIAKLILGYLFLTFPYIGNIDSSVLQIENAPVVDISDYVIKHHSKFVIFLINLAYLVVLLVMSSWQRCKIVARDENGFLGSVPTGFGHGASNIPSANGQVKYNGNSETRPNPKTLAENMAKNGGMLAKIPPENNQ